MAVEAALSLLEPGTLTVCVSTSFPPVAYKRDGELIGTDIDFLHGFAASQGLNLRYVECPFDGIWLRPGSGDCDVAASGITERPPRHSTGVVWSDPYFTVLRTLLVRRSDLGELNAIADFGGRTIGFVGGSTAEVDTRRQASEDTALIPYEQAERGIADLLAGRIDGFADGNITSRHFLKVEPRLVMIDEHSMGADEVLAFPMRAASNIATALNRYIAANRGAYGE